MTKSIKLSNDILIGAIIELVKEGKQVKMNISGSSMNPFLYDGDTIVIRYITLNEVNLGDVVLGKYNNIYVLHRVIHKKKDCIFIAGDNNLSQIEKIESKDIYALATGLVKSDEIVNLTNKIYRFKGLFWYYLRPFRRIYIKLFKNINV